MDVLPNKVDLLASKAGAQRGLDEVHGSLQVTERTARFQASHASGLSFRGKRAKRVTHVENILSGLPRTIRATAQQRNGAAARAGPPRGGILQKVVNILLNYFYKIWLVCVCIGIECCK